MIRFLKLLNAPCRDMAALASRAMDERLPWSARVAFRSHLLYCKACRRYRRQLHVIHSVLASVRTTDAPSPEPGRLTLGEDARQRMIAALSDGGKTEPRP